MTILIFLRHLSPPIRKVFVMPTMLKSIVLLYTFLLILQYIGEFVPNKLTEKLLRLLNLMTLIDRPLVQNKHKQHQEPILMLLCIYLCMIPIIWISMAQYSLKHPMWQYHSRLSHHLNQGLHQRYVYLCPMPLPK